MNDVINKGPFLRTSRSFPVDSKLMQSEMNRSYVDIAHKVNSRTIGFFTIDRSIVNGEQWFITQNQKQQGLRQVYRWDDTLLVGSVITIAHGINFMSLTNFIRIWGTFFDSTNWQTLPYVDVVNVTNQITVEVNKTNIVITKGAGSPPTATNGLVILEWLANP